MRAALSAVVAVLAFAPAAAPAADAPRRLHDVRSSASAAPIDGPVSVERVARPKGVVVQKLAGQRYRVTEADGTALTRSFPIVPAPRRIEDRVYYSPDNPARRPHLLYGGFYGLDRWGVGREDE